MPGKFPPSVRPLLTQKSVHIIWDSFEYYSPLKRLLKYACDYPHEPLSLAQAAGIASLDYTHFSGYFRKKTGVTFKYWIDFIRVGHAARMLESTDKSILDVAHDCGFSDSTTFSRTFRRVIGMTPMQFRRRRAPDAIVPGMIRLHPEETPKKSEKPPKETEESPRL